jgi:hypothetical protein
MKATKKPLRKGLIVQPDDLELRRFYAVYGTKVGPEQPVPVAGMAFELLAVNLPFVVGKLTADPTHPPLTLDVRYLTFMRVSDDYVQAQRTAEDAP